MVVVDILWWVDDHGMGNLELNYEILAVSRILRKHRRQPHKATITIEPRISTLRRTSFHLFKFSIFLLKPASFPANLAVQTSSCLSTNYLEGQSTNRQRWTCQSMFQLMIQMQILNGSNYRIFSIIMIFANHPGAPQE